MQTVTQLCWNRRRPALFMNVKYVSKLYWGDGQNIASYICAKKLGIFHIWEGQQFPCVVDLIFIKVQIIIASDEWYQWPPVQIKHFIGQNCFWNERLSFSANDDWLIKIVIIISFVSNFLWKSVWESHIVTTTIAPHFKYLIFIDDYNVPRVVWTFLLLGFW